MFQSSEGSSNEIFYKLLKISGVTRVKYLKTIDKIINLPHKTLHEDDFGQTNTHVFEFCWKRLHLTEVMQLHS